MQQTIKLPSEPKVLAATINPYTGDKMFTVLFDFPTVLLAELRTHKIITQGSLYEHSESNQLSLSANSARALPISKYIEKVKQCPYIPIWTTKQRGMSGGEPTKEQIDAFNKIHLEKLDFAIKKTQELLDLGCHKQDANRGLSEFAFTTCVLSGTEWDNFFKLRISPHAQPAFNFIAKKIKELYDKTYFLESIFHIPYQKLIFEKFENDFDKLIASNRSYLETKNIKNMLAMIVSASKCAKLSYDTQDCEDSFEKHMNRVFNTQDGLLPNNHAEPFSHQAVIMGFEDLKSFIVCSMKNGQIIDENWCWTNKGFITQRYMIKNMQEEVYKVLGEMFANPKL